MSSFKLLNSKEHKDLRVSMQYFPDLGYDVGATSVLPSEIIAVQREYPILFRKNDETGAFLPVALLGFEAKENVFIDADGEWQADYIPASMVRGPFLIGVDEDKNTAVYIDMDDPRVGVEEGDLLFNDDDKPTEAMDRVSAALSMLHHEQNDMKAMVDAFLEADLIETVSLKMQFNDGNDFNFAGAYTIDVEKIGGLDPEALAKLNKSGYLGLAYFIAGSIGNVQKLIDFKNLSL
ncbi:MAG: multidrug transporter [Alteromonadaceae bacterium]|nr:MAG: multidrug transporter [Alteromonadaceae bacterium]